jgi:hypothetical protein
LKIVLRHCEGYTSGVMRQFELHPTCRIRENQTVLYPSCYKKLSFRCNNLSICCTEEKSMIIYLSSHVIMGFLI